MHRFYVPAGNGEKMNDTLSNCVVAALYRFTKFSDFESFRAPLLELMRAKKVRGTILLASEGINGTIAGSREGVNVVVDWIKRDLRFEELKQKSPLRVRIPFTGAR